MNEILSLTILDVLWLRDELRTITDDDEGGVGVREPRRPKPLSPGDYIALKERLEDERKAPGIDY